MNCPRNIETNFCTFMGWPRIIETPIKQTGTAQNAIKTTLYE